MRKLKCLVGLLVLNGLFANSTLLGKCPDSLNVYLGQVRQTLRSNQYDLSEKERFVSQFLAVGHEWKNSLCFIGAGKLFHYVGIFYGSGGNQDSAQKYYSQALTLFDKEALETQKDSIHLAILFYNFSKMFERKEEFGNALNMTKNSLLLRESMGYRRRIGHVYRNMGLINGYLTNYEDGIKYHRLSLQTFQQEGGSMVEQLKQHNNLSAMFAMMGELDSVHFHTKQVWEKSGDSLASVKYSSTYNLANAYFYTGDFSKAEEIFLEGLELLESIPASTVNSSNFVGIYNALGLTYLKKEELTKGLAAFQQAQRYISDQSSVNIQFEVQKNIAYTYKMLEMPDSSQKYYQLSLDLIGNLKSKRDSSLANNTGYLLEMVDNQQQLLKNRKELNQQRLSIQYLISGLLMASLIIVLLIFFQQKQRAKQKELLKRTIYEADKRVVDAIVSIYKEEQNSLVAERNNLGKILHETIQGRISISKMLIENIESDVTMKEGDTEEHFQLIKLGLENSIKEVRIISHKLKDGKPYYEQYYEEFVVNLERILALYQSTKIFQSFECNIDPQIRQIESLGREISDSLKIDILFWVRGLLTNMIKHSHATRAFFTLGLHDNHLILKVEDNGVGVDPEWQKWIGDSTGLQGIQNEVESYQGLFDIKSKEGTQVHISIPLPPKPINEIIITRE